MKKVFLIVGFILVVGVAAAAAASRKKTAAPGPQSTPAPTPAGTDPGPGANLMPGSGNQSVTVPTQTIVNTIAEQAKTVVSNLGGPTEEIVAAGQAAGKAAQAALAGGSTVGEAVQAGAVAAESAAPVTAAATPLAATPEVAAIVPEAGGGSVLAGTGVLGTALITTAVGAGILVGVKLLGDEILGTATQNYGPGYDNKTGDIVDPAAATQALIDKGIIKANSGGGGKVLGITTNGDTGGYQTIINDQRQ